MLKSSSPVDRSVALNPPLPSPKSAGQKWENQSNLVLGDGLEARFSRREATPTPERESELEVTLPNQLAGVIPTIPDALKFVDRCP